MRTCIGCRRRGRPGELVRCALSAEGSVVISATAPGRGAWLCRGAVSCFDEAVKRRRFDRAFRRPTGSAALETVRATFAVTTPDVRQWTLAKG